MRALRFRDRPANSRALMLAGCLAAASGASWAQAGPALDFWPMSAGVHPVIDGQVTWPLPASPGVPANAEWARANAVLNDQGDGTYRAQWQRDWVATSVNTGNQAAYGGVTLFVMHDIWGYRTQEPADYNTFSFTFAGNNVTAWIFANGDEPNDAAWIDRSGIGRPAIADVGFLVRLNNDPATDRQWFPGNPEPGDPGWNWNQFYGFFGRAGFNDSAFAAGLPLSVNGQPNEVYELALYGAAFPGAGPGGFVPCVTTITVMVMDPKAGEPAVPIPVEVKVFGPGHVNAVPEPGTYAMFLAGLGLLSGIARRRKDRA